MLFDWFSFICRASRLHKFSNVVHWGDRSHWFRCRCALKIYSRFGNRLNRLIGSIHTHTGTHAKNKKEWERERGGEGDRWKENMTKSFVHRTNFKSSLIIPSFAFGCLFTANTRHEHIDMKQRNTKQNMTCDVDDRETEGFDQILALNCYEYSFVDQMCVLYIRYLLEHEHVASDGSRGRFTVVDEFQFGFMQLSASVCYGWSYRIINRSQ